MTPQLPGTVVLSVPGFEDVRYYEDPACGLRAVIAVHSTALGPALGGTRCHPYPTLGAALDDVLGLARTMTFKSAAAGLPLGGGKAVILCAPAELSRRRLHGYARFVESFRGRYITAADAGTTSEDLDRIAERTRHVVGLTTARGGSGDTGDMTAFGVAQAMRAAAGHRWGTPELTGRHVGVEGFGKVGARLAVRLAVRLAEAGARVSVFDVRPHARTEAAARGFSVHTSAGELRQAGLDVLAPCGMGHRLDKKALERLSAAVVCGGANVPLAGPEPEQALHDAGVLYVPDFIANAGGLVQAADELSGYSAERVRAKVAAIREVTASVLRIADAEGLLPHQAAERLAAQRLAVPADAAGDGR